MKKISVLVVSLLAVTSVQPGGFFGKLPFHTSHSTPSDSGHGAGSQSSSFAPSLLSASVDTGNPLNHIMASVAASGAYGAATPRTPRYVIEEMRRDMREVFSHVTPSADASAAAAMFVRQEQAPEVAQIITTFDNQFREFMQAVLQRVILEAEQWHDHTESFSEVEEQRKECAELVLDTLTTAEKTFIETIATQAKYLGSRLNNSEKLIVKEPVHDKSMGGTTVRDFITKQLDFLMKSLESQLRYVVTTWRSEAPSLGLARRVIPGLALKRNAERDRFFADKRNLLTLLVQHAGLVVHKQMAFLRDAITHILATYSGAYQRAIDQGAQESSPAVSGLSAYQLGAGVEVVHDVGDEEGDELPVTTYGGVSTPYSGVTSRRAAPLTYHASVAHSYLPVTSRRSSTVAHTAITRDRHFGEDAHRAGVFSVERSAPEYHGPGSDASSYSSVEYSGTKGIHKGE